MLRKEWFGYVAKIRRKLARKNKAPVSHQVAMKEAALTWPQEKLRIYRRKKKEDAKILKVRNTSQPPVKNTSPK